MGEALIRGFVAAGVCSPDTMVASTRSAERRANLASMGVLTVGDAVFENGAAEVAANSDIIFLGVRPGMALHYCCQQQLPQLVPDLYDLLLVGNGHLRCIASMQPV